MRRSGRPPRAVTSFYPPVVSRDPVQTGSFDRWLTPGKDPLAMPTKGNPRVTVRLSPEEIAALRALAAGRPVSDVIRERLRGSQGLVPSISLDVLKLDAELAQIETEARRHVLSQPQFSELARVGGEEAIRDLERELRVAQAVGPDDPKAYARAQAQIKDLTALLARLRKLQAEAEVQVAEKAKELKISRGLEPLVDVSGGSLAKAIQDLVSAADGLEELRERYRFVLDSEEAREAIAAAEKRVNEAQGALEALIAKYSEALALRRQREEERDRERRTQQEKARQTLRPCAEELFRTAQEFEKALDEIRRDFLAHPGIQKVDLLAQKLWELRREFNAKLNQAGEVERGLVPRPSKAVQEMLKVLRARYPEEASDINAQAMAMLKWIVNAVVRLDEDGIPTITPLPPTIKVEGPRIPTRRG